MTTNVLNNSERTKCEIWSRVVGYLRPVSQWNKGKKSEYFDRKVANKESYGETK